MLGAFLDRIEADDGARDAYLEAAAALGDRVVFTGRLEHAELAELLPACEALVMPSTFPEAFGMVTAEAAACGALPVSAGHSGMAEVSQALAGQVPEAARDWLSFPLGDRAVDDLASRISAWLSAPEELRERTREALVATARERWSWEGVAEGVIAAAQGRLDVLAPPR
jgi:glycosyltransferase involved in cell wall biosynthesis